MKITTICCTALLLVACSTKRHTESNNAASTTISQLRHDSANHRDTLVEVFGRQFHLNRELLAIAPVGTFTYHPDSGFSGQASRILVYREQAQTVDTLHRRRGIETRQATDLRITAQHQETASQKEDRTSRHAFGFPGWLVIAGLSLALFLSWKLLRIQR